VGGAATRTLSGRYLRDRRGQSQTSKTLIVSALDWLLSADPAIRWQAMRDLTDTPAAEVAAEQARVATEG
jgi:hypothetical protein